MPKYAALIYSEEATEPPSSEQWADVMAEYGEFGETAGAAGVILAGEALQGVDTATTVHVDGGKGGTVHTTDGPFAETLGGFYLLECDDLDQAIHWASQIPGAWHGRVEVRPLVTFEEG